MLLTNEEVLDLVSIAAGIGGRLATLGQKMGLVRDVEAAVLAKLQAQSEHDRLVNKCDKSCYANPWGECNCQKAPVQQEQSK